MKRKNIAGLIALLTIVAVVMFVGCVEKDTPAEKAPAIGITIKIEATSSTWRAEEPYDIYSATKEKLERVGFEVVSEESDLYDAMLFVDYEEKKGGEYWSGGHGTRIKCNLKLCDKTDNLLFEKEISASTYYKVPVGTDLYEDAVEGFESKVYFRYLGEMIATKYGVGDEVSVVISALKDKHFRARRDAAWILKNTGETLKEAADVRPVEPLIEVLSDKDRETRSGAVLALGNIGDARAVEPLIQVLKDEDRGVQQSAASALGNIGDERAVEPLIEALSDEEKNVRREAADALGEIGDARAVEPLIQALKDEDWYVRSTAAKALGKIGDERAVEPLTNALEDEDKCVQKAAREALEKIQGK